MRFNYINEDNIQKSLIDFSNGDTFSLFKLALSSLDSPGNLLNDSNFIINMFSIVDKEEDKNFLFDLMISRNLNLIRNYIEIDDKKITKFNKFWDSQIPNDAPIIFFLLPYLNDKQFSTILKDYSISKLKDEEKTKILIEPLVLSLFKNGFHNSLSELKNEYFILSSLATYEPKKVHGFEDELSLDEAFFKYCLKNPLLLDVYSKITYSSLETKSDSWMNYHLNQEKIDIPLVISFIETIFPLVTDFGKETIIARTLSQTKNFDLLKVALNKHGTSNISSYFPEEIPLWAYSSEHKNPIIFKKLLNNGADIFDYFPISNTIFLSSILDSNTDNKDFKTLLSENKIEYKTFLQKLFEQKTDNNGTTYNNFALILTTGEAKYNSILNINYDDLEILSKKFSKQNLEKTGINKKLQLISNILEQTFFAPVYAPSTTYSSTYLKEREINFNVYLSNESFSRKSIFLIDEHLSLLSQNDNLEIDYRGKYFQIVSQLFDFYGTKKIKESTERYQLYMTMIDYCATDKTLNWNLALEKLNHQSITDEKINFYEGSMNLYNYLNKICLSHTMTENNVIEKKKIKI
ncbi:hypothetical protein GW796_07810 [archaeon]|nr:hypothetical protein [archaeon]